MTSSEKQSNPLFTALTVTRERSLIFLRALPGRLRRFWNDLPAHITRLRHDLPVHARRLRAELPDRLRAVRNWFVTLYLSLPARFQRARTAFVGYLRDLAEKPDTRYRTVLGALGIVFVALFSLASINPFTLLVPGLYYYPPMPAGTNQITLHGISQRTGEIIRVKRLVDLDEDRPLEERALQIAHAVSRPLELSENRAAKRYEDLEPLPPLALSVRKIWYLSEKKQLILDLRRETLLEETRLFLQERGNDSVRRYYLLDGYFGALTPSLFAALPEVKSVQYLLDGRTESLEGMRYDLALTRTAQTGGSAP